MDALTFWNKVGASDGHYCIFSPDIYGKQEFFTDKQDAIERAVELGHQGSEAFFALATFNDDTSREFVNAVSYKSLFLDLDVKGEGHPDVLRKRAFVSRKAALLALKKFCKSVGLPAPLIVSSGLGFHVYWILTEAVPADEWKPVADKFKAICIDQGIHIDPTVPADGARVLRLPGTLHNKDPENPIKVEVFGSQSSVEHPLSFYRELFKVTKTHSLSPALLANMRKQFTDEQREKLSAGLDKNDDSKNYSFAQLIQKTKRGTGCKQFEVIARHQETCAEPLWRAGLSITKFCREGLDAAIKISERHPDYSESETVQKYNQIKGPYTCQAFFNENPETCKECPHWKGWDKKGTPLRLAKLIPNEAKGNVTIKPADADAVAEVAPVPEIKLPKLPPPYFWSEEQQVLKRVRGDDGEEDVDLVSEFPIFIASLVVNRDQEHTIVVHIKPPHDELITALIPASSFAKPTDLKEILSGKGVIENLDKVREYLMAVFVSTQKRRAAEKAIDHFGWQEDGSFVLGGFRYMPDGSTEVNHPTPETAQYFNAMRPRGKLEDWKKLMAFYSKPGMELHQFAICLCLGSPLMEFIPNIFCVNLHLYAKDSGIGKTTSSFAGLSIWGNYKQLGIDAKDTGNFLRYYPKVMKNLPILVDEITNLTGEEQSDFLYMWSSGQDKNRMKSSVNQARDRGETWSLAVITTSNKGMINSISGFKDDPRAEIQRVIESPVTEVQGLTKDKTDELNRQLVDNYGLAGPMFVRSLMKIKHQLPNAIKAMQKQVDKEFSLTYKNRFWSAELTIALLANKMAKKLGLWDFDEKRLIAAMKLIMDTNKQSAKDTIMTPLDHLSSFVNSNVMSFVRVTSPDEESPLQNLIQPTNYSTAPRSNKIVGRYEYDTNRLCIGKAEFKQFLTRNQNDFQWVSNELKNNYGGYEKKVRLTSGTDLPKAAPITCIVFDNPSFGDLFGPDDE